MITAELRVVGIGEIGAIRGEADFAGNGVGGGVVFAAFDAKARIAAFGHFILPKAPTGFDRRRPGKYVDSGVQEAVDRMIRMGADPARIRAALLGGASVRTGDGPSVMANLGHRNVEAAHGALAELGLRCIAQDVGGQHGRSVVFTTRDGVVRVSSLFERERVLCRLGE
jgi:chemotaxis protein CheD